MTLMTDPSSMTRTSGAFRTLLGMLAFHRGALVLGIVFALVNSVGALLQPEVMNRIIGEVGHGSVTDLVLVLFAIMLVTAVASACQIFVLNRTAEAAVFQTRGRLIARMLRLPMARYDSMRTGDLVTRLGSDTTLIRSAFTGGLVDAIAGVVTMLGSIILMALIDVFLLSMVLVLVAGTVVIVVIASKKIQRYTKQLQKSVGLLGAGMDRALVAIRTIRAANAQQQVEDDLVAEAERAFGKGKQTAKIEAFLYPVSGLALQASFLIVLGVGGARVSTGTIAVGDLVAFALYLFMLAMPLGQIFGAVTTIRSAMGAIERIQEVLDTPEESTAGDEAQLASSLSFDAISFSYPSAKEMEGESVESVVRTEVLHDVSFQIPAGKVTAFVGPSGSGKSTTLALMQRFYDPDSGTIYLGEQNMSGLTRESVRRSIGYVEQEAAVLAGTVRDNLLLARYDATDGECWDCVRQVGLDQHFQQAEGLDTLIGDRGMSLSGGQRQRLALARMLLMDAPILLLDEPTSAVDSRNEQLILDAIADSARGRTLVVVAHRLSTVIDADQIIVMEAGRVVAVGTHEELLQISTLYRDLAHRQLLD
ncbi:ABC transporter ATP-binding protein [Corynebacterium anserum]|uniref:ATP-binding cassette domain-containing protein n=1 Tax=Corynebacterium anserum TaxID=2684406 RepID=A0A7G7YN46_9CORY|nr:ABC transporter ATP-binding protein [Corynebacterium anserum]QNH95916.1 ATP-binding cassette domain-containing protein [Corynebacterium anserum]